MRLPWFVALASLSVACGTPEDQRVSQQKWMTGAGPARGHEDLTRLAVERANNALEAQLGFRPYPAIAQGVAGIDSGNSMIKGNFESDFPSNRMQEFHDMPTDDSIDWHNDGRIQHIHSLRNIIGGQALSKQDSCKAIRANIINASRRAVDSYSAGAIEDGRYWLGHATHVIQDSFSNAHTTRSKDDGGRTISDICVYGASFDGICQHSSFDSHDYVWRDKWSCRFNPNERDIDCLKNEAQNAVHATAAYLVNAGETIFTGKPLDESLQGYFACEGLSP
jgi:hypothetical protein